MFLKATVLVNSLAVWLQQSHSLSTNGTNRKMLKDMKLENQSNILASQRMDAVILALWGRKTLEKAQN